VARPIAIIRTPEGAPAKLRLAGAFDFHHKRPVIPRTDTNPPVGDNGIDLLSEAQRVPAPSTQSE
jgi:hypothetical protein